MRPGKHCVKAPVTEHIQPFTTAGSQESTCTNPTLRHLATTGGSAISRGSAGGGRARMASCRDARRRLLGGTATGGRRRRRRRRRLAGGDTTSGRVGCAPADTTAQCTQGRARHHALPWEPRNYRAGGPAGARPCYCTQPAPYEPHNTVSGSRRSHGVSGGGGSGGSVNTAVMPCRTPHSARPRPWQTSTEPELRRGEATAQLAPPRRPRLALFTGWAETLAARRSLSARGRAARRGRTLAERWVSQRVPLAGDEGSVQVPGWWWVCWEGRGNCCL